MEELLVTRRGSTLVPLDEDAENRLREFAVGAILKAKITRPRSPEHNSFFHVCIQEAFWKWPRDHPQFQPDDWKHLRAWLLCKAGHCQKMVVTVSSGEEKLLKPIIQAFRSFFETDKERYIWVGIKDHALMAVRPLSLKYSDVDQHWFQPIADRVFDILQTEGNFNVDEHHRKWQEDVAAGRRKKPANKKAGA